MRKIFGVLLFVFLLATTGFASAANTASVSVVHGIPGLVVDVYLNGALTIPNFQPGTVVGPVNLAAGNYAVVIVPAGGNPANPALSANLTLSAGVSYSAVAHLDANGAPKLSAFVNNTTPTSGSRLTIRHTAAAPAVDAVVSPGKPGQTSYGPLSNGQEATLELGTGPLSAGLAPAGTTNIIFGPQSVNFQKNTLYIAYAVGNLSAGQFGVILQRIPLS